MSEDMKFLCEKQIPNCFNEKMLTELLSIQEIFNARKVIIICCKDLIGVAKQMKFYISLKCKIFLGIDIYDVLDTEMPSDDKSFNLGEPDSPCVIVLSKDGEEEKLCEKAKYFTEKKAMTIAITFNNNSSLVNICKRSVTLEKMNNGTLDLDYFSFVIGILGIISRISEVKGYEPTGSINKWKTVLEKYLLSYENIIENNNLTSLKNDFQSYPFSEFIYDEYLRESESFINGLLSKKTGIFTGYIDSEDWCHINYFYENTNEIVTIFFANSESSSYNRILEAMATSAKIGRNVYAICSHDLNMQGVKTIVMPNIEKGYEWIKMIFEPLVINFIMKGDLNAEEAN